MTDHGLGGRRALAGFLYQMLATAAYSAKVVESDAGGADLGEVALLLKAGSRTAAEPLLGEDLAVYLKSDEFALIQFKSSPKIDLSTFRNVIAGFARTYARLTKAQQGDLRALVLVTPGPLTDGLPTICFRAARKFGCLLGSDAEDSCWAKHVGHTIADQSSDSDCTFEELAEKIRQQVTQGADGAEIAFGDPKSVFRLLHVVTGQTLEAYVTLLETEARKRGVLDEELDGAIQQVVGLVFASSVERWRDLNREILLTALTGQRHHPAGYAHPSAVYDGLRRTWQEWAPRKDPTYAQLVETRQVEAVLGRMSGRLPEGWLAISGEGGVGKTGVLLLSCKKRCEPAEVGGTWYLPVHVDLPAGEGRDDLLRRLSEACGRSGVSDEGVLDRIATAAQANSEQYRIVVVSDGADEHRAIASAGFAGLVTLARRHSDQLSFVFSSRTTVLDYELLPVVSLASGWDSELESARLAEGIVEIADFASDSELLGFLQDLGLQEVVDVIVGHSQRTGGEWRETCQLPMRVYFLAILKRLKESSAMEYDAAVHALLSDSDDAAAALRPVAEQVINDLRTRYTKLTGHSGQTAVDVLSDLASERSFVVQANTEELELCRQAADCALLDEGRLRQFRWTSEFIRAYLESL